MSLNFTVKTKEGTQGPFSQEKLAKLLEAKKIPEAYQVTCVENGKTYPAKDAVRLTPQPKVDPPPEPSIFDDVDLRAENEVLTEGTELGPTSAGTVANEDSFVKFINQSESSALGNVAVALYLLFCFLPAVEKAGFFFNLEFIANLSVTTLALISIIPGIVGGLIVFRKPWYSGLVAGGISFPLTVVAVYAYLVDRTEVFKIELLVLGFVAAAPGVALAYLIYKMKGEE